MNYRAERKKLYSPNTTKRFVQLTRFHVGLMVTIVLIQVISVCAKSYKIIAPLWRQVRSQLKKRQVANQRGSILAVNFIAVLEDNGIILDKKEIGTLVKNFRGTGLQEVVKYDEFFKVCLLAKDMSP